MLNKTERIDQLYSQNIKIIQSPQVFSFSLDAVLLADFANVPKYGQIYDFCAGNGAVGLFVSAKTKAQIHLVEIQPELADMAQRSVALNHLEAQLTVENQPVQNLTQQLAHDSVDYITCNPPYFRVQELSRQNPNPHLAIARHELKITIEDVIQVSSQVLKTNGKLALVFRPDRLDELFQLFKTYHFAPKRIRFIYPKADDDKDANMVLVEALKNGRPNGVKILKPLFAYNHGQYSSEVQALLYGSNKES
ncbi:methyltransferase [Agrilactobacillus composti DSM 18527 = JCM 14202]|uniref:Methyltransferase n=1 Tax=Agrilactobacillus composti DSM 18527 = JCM 14202 TaxID=1423734 RepID=X0PUV4_9LACO|nr:tRNA1(Val) (adenine(37)-N6)-methyltransferase [Agrilactobacillus composti]KRM36832.1 methyltransferase [Agrilactobacillus composti DSM 18527 = JCM 14202]GAF41226.1 predicted O-methyltransferase [Agrilactobacillus composti DSM 18527 = JCM 14202]